MTFGVTPTGLVLKDLATLLAEIEASERGSIDPQLITSAESLFGEMNAIMAGKFRELWELAGAVNDARDPANATGAQLVAAAALTGTARAPATRGFVALQVQLNPGTTLPAGAVANVAGQPANRWRTTADASLSIGAGSPQWVNVSGEAESPGVFPANASTITTIATPFAGWLAVRNPNDAIAGRGVETDAELRLRRAQELTHGGGTALESIRTTLLELRSAAGNPLISACVVDENTTDYLDAFGRPPHTVEVIIQHAAGASDPGALELFLHTLWLVKPGGVAYYGATSPTTVDSMGVTRTVASSEALPVNIYVSATIAIDHATYPGDAAMKDAIVAWGNAKLMGEDVILAKLEALIVTSTGVNDIGSLLLSLDGSGYFSRNIPIDARQVAKFGSSRVTLVSA